MQKQKCEVFRTGNLFSPNSIFPICICLHLAICLYVAICFYVRCRRICQPAMGFTRPSFVSSCMSSAAGRLARYSKEAPYKIKIMMGAKVCRNNLKLIRSGFRWQFSGAPSPYGGLSSPGCSKIVTQLTKMVKVDLNTCKIWFPLKKIGLKPCKRPIWKASMVASGHPEVHGTKSNLSPTNHLVQGYWSVCHCYNYLVAKYVIEDVDNIN